MKANELRFGNLVNSFLGIDGDGAQYEICKVLQVGEDWLQLDNNQLNTHINNVIPIQLTEEWLVKFGFKFKSYGEEVYEQIWEFENGFDIWQHDKGFCHQFLNGGDINHVHQLQNLYFALTGEELIYTP